MNGEGVITVEKFIGNKYYYRNSLLYKNYISLNKVMWLYLNQRAYLSNENIRKLLNEQFQGKNCYLLALKIKSFVFLLKSKEFS